jgi:hypothetical protein
VRPCDGGESRFTGRPVPVEFEACLLQVVMVLFSQIQTPQNAALRLQPGSVNLYSTLGGIPGSTVLVTRPSRPICRIVFVSISG